MFNVALNQVARPKGCQPFMGLTVEQARAQRPADMVVKNECCDFDYAPGVVKTADGVIEILDYIGGWGVYACEVIPVLRAMDGEGKTILIRINSYGGDVFEGLAIANTIAALKAHTIVEVIGMAASIASIITIAADEVRIYKSAEFMIHRPWALVIGNADDMRDSAAHLDKIQGQLIEAYVDRSAGKKDKATISAAVVKASYFTGAEAVEWGFADLVLEKAKVAPKVDAAALEAAGIKDVAKEEAPVVPKQPTPVAQAAATETTTTAPAPTAPVASAEGETAPAALSAPVLYAAADIAAIRAAFARTKRPAAADEAMAGGLTVEQAKALAFDMLADEDAHEPVNTTLVSNETPAPAQKSPEQVMAEIRARQFAEFQSNR